MNENAWQSIACGLISALVCSLTVNIFWRRRFDKLADAWTQDHRRQRARIEELETELGDVEQASGEPMASEKVINAINAICENPTAYEIEKWETPDGLSIIVRPKADKEGEA